MTTENGPTLPVEHGSLESLNAIGALSTLDLHLGLAVQRLSNSSDAIIGLSAALASRAVQAGHVCLQLDSEDASQLVGDDGEAVRVDLPDAAEWRTRLLAGSVVCCEQGDKDRVSPSHALILREDNLYLQRYARYQQRLVATLAPRIRIEAVDRELLGQSVQRLFPQQQNGIDYQRVAAVLAATRNFCLISGGPGTGKTTTVAKVLVILLEQLAASTQVPRISLVAPTGKAAQRLTESLARSVSDLPTSEAIKTHLRLKATTIHRALGYQPRTPTHFYHDLTRPLPADIVLVDEASMVDLALMTKLFEAVPARSRILLLGDKDQLASVEAGAILGDLFNEDAGHGYSKQTVQECLEVGSDPLPLSDNAFGPRDCTVHLQRSYRYKAGGGIGQLALAIRTGDHTAFHRACDDSSITWRAESRLSLGSLRASVEAGYGSLMRAKSPEEKLEALDSFRILAAHRRGANGVEVVNRWTEELLTTAGYLAGSSGSHYNGRPIMIVQNDYNTDLFNGDVGVIHRATDTGRFYAYFGGSSGVRRVLASRLPPHETAYAMTVHKSQGTEFGSVCLVCPEHASKIFTRELLYTGVTRAKKFVELIGSDEVIATALKSRVRRASGLKRAIWG